jgi:predicted nucleic acid-binding protein
MPKRLLIYFDNGALLRPFDDRSQLRIDIEADAILGLLDRMEAGQIAMLSSDVLKYEHERMPDSERKEFADDILMRCNHCEQITSAIISKAMDYERIGIKPWDALHLATAVERKTDYFCTCDDVLLKKAKAAQTDLTIVISPLELISATSE